MSKATTLTPEQQTQLKPLMAKVKAEGWDQWVRSDADRLAMLDGHYFDVAAAERIAAFCKQLLRLENPNPSDGRGWMLMLELLEFQFQDILGPLMGWKRADGTRRFRFAFVTMAKGNSKSVLAAIVLLYLIFAEGEPVPRGYACSTSSNAARTVFEFCCRMVANSPALSKRLKVFEQGGRIINPDARAILKIAPNKAQALEGKDVHCAVYDEIHLARNRELFDAMIYGGRSRTQPLIMVITTAASDRTSIAYELFDDAQKLLSGAVVDHARFAYIAANDHEADPLDRKAWHRANPGLGVTLNADDFAVEAQRAVDSPAKLANFRRRRLNVWGLSDTTTFINLDRWLACHTDLDAERLAGRECYGGLDMSSNIDLTAFVLVFPDPSGNGSLDLLAWHWLPEDVIAQRAKIDCDQYPRWAHDGHLEMTDGDFIDQPFIRQRISELGAKYKIKEIAYDPTFMSDIGPKLATDGFEVFEFWQTHRMYTPVMAKLDELVLGKLIRHNNPILDWQASNLLAQTNQSGHMKPAKPSKGAKIDGMCALLMSLGRIVKGDGPPEESPYDFCPVISV